MKGEILTFLTNRHRPFAKKEQEVQYWPFPKEGKGNTALLSRKGSGTIPLFFQGGARGNTAYLPRSIIGFNTALFLKKARGFKLPFCQGGSWSSNCPFPKEGQGCNTVLLRKEGQRGNTAYLPRNDKEFNTALF